jgi:hypothetical protein
MPEEVNRGEEPARKRSRRFFWLLVLALPLVAVLYRVFELYHR